MYSIYKRICLAFMVLLTGAIVGCGTPYATVKNGVGDPVMLLGYDPVAYFTQGKPVKGTAQHQVKLPERSYYFASAEHKALFKANAAKYEPQYGGFCASGAAYALKLSSDPSAWKIMNDRLFIFGDSLGYEAWKLDPAWNVGHADALWLGRQPLSQTTRLASRRRLRAASAGVSRISNHSAFTKNQKCL